MTNLYTRLEAGFPEDRSRVFAELPGGSSMTYAGVAIDDGRRRRK